MSSKKKKKAAKKTKRSDFSLEKTKEWIALYLAAVAAIIVPLYIKSNGYIQLIETKAKAFLFLTLPALAIMAAVNAASLALNKTDKQEPDDQSGRNGSTARSIFRAAFTKENIGLVLLVLIAAWALLSTVLSEAPMSSFLGLVGWSMGSLMITTLVICTICYAKYLRFHEKLLIPFMIANTFIFIFAVIQMTDCDPFGFLAMIEKKYRYSYLATIGQKNAFSGYLCLTLPLIWGIFAEVRERRQTMLVGVFTALGFMAIIAASSDSTLAGIGICAIFMLPFFLYQQERTKRAGILLIIYGMCLLFSGRFSLFSGKLEHIRDFSGRMLSLPCCIGIAALGVLLCLFAEKSSQQNFQKRSKIVLLIFEIAIFAVIAAAVVYSALHFDNKWGTNRGYIWRVGWSHFRRAPIREKIFGLGPELIAPVYVKYRITRGANVVSAHCEPLHILLTQGIIGLLLYFSFWGYMIAAFIRKRLWKKKAAMFFFPLAAYLGQSVFCTPYPVTAAVFSLMTGLYYREMYAPGSDGAYNSNYSTHLQNENKGGTDK